MIRKKDLLNEINNLRKDLNNTNLNMEIISNNMKIISNNVINIELDKYINKYGLQITTYQSSYNSRSSLLNIGDIELKKFNYYDGNNTILKWIKENEKLIASIVEKKLTKSYQKTVKCASKKKK